jgi:hypothetical protein
VTLNKYFDQQLVNKKEKDLDEIQEEPVTTIVFLFCPYFIAFVSFVSHISSLLAFVMN